MKLTLTKQEVLLIQLLLHIYKNELPDDGTEKHGRFVGKLYKKIKRQVINQLKLIKLWNRIFRGIILRLKQ
jgi:hypothetical protein